MRGRDSAHIFLDMRIHRPKNVWTHRPIHPQSHGLQRLTDPHTHTFTEIHVMTEHGPTDHTLPAPWVSLGPPAEPHARLLQARRDWWRLAKSTSWELLQKGKALQEKRTRGRERSKRSKGKGGPSKEAGARRGGGMGEGGRRAMHPLPPTQPPAASLPDILLSTLTGHPVNKGRAQEESKHEPRSLMRACLVTLCAFRSC